MINGSSELASELARLGVSSLPLAWQFFADSDVCAMISIVVSYYHLDVEVHAEFPNRVPLYW